MFDWEDIRHSDDEELRAMLRNKKGVKICF